MKELRFTMEQPSGAECKEQGARFYEISPIIAMTRAKQYMRIAGIKRASLRWEEKDANGEWITISVASLTNK